MSASQECRARGNARARYLVVLAFLAGCGPAAAGDEPRPASPDCDRAGVIAHVMEQFRVYGPRSAQHEFFGFVYRVEGELFSVVVRGNKCRGPNACTVDAGRAASRIPRNAKVLGEWHTHTHQTGSRMLSHEDVRGARQNVHIRCYAAFYAGPDGNIYAWDPHSTSVVTAMDSRIALGRYSPDSDPARAPQLAAAAAEAGQ